MAIEKVEFEFPGEKEEDFKIEVEGNRAEFESANAGKEPEVEIEVVDDTPPKDRNRKPSEPPEELSDDELENYSERVKKRMQHFSKGYHDERRAKEQALRERQELERLAKQLVEENQKLKGTVNKNQEILIEQAKKTVAAELEDAKRKYKAAYESGDADAVVAAQEEMTSVKMKAEKVNNFKPAPLQEENSVVQSEQIAPQASVDERAETWRQENGWFGSDDEMTSFALGLHQKLVKSGVDPRSDEYYERINSRMRQVFPENFEANYEQEPEEKPARKANVVAPATRSTASKKVVLTQTQVALAKRLGVSLADYAAQVALEGRK